MNERDIEFAKQAWTENDWDGHVDIPKLIDLIRADEREALIKFFDNHWRSDWSDGQIIEALEARGNT
jgi:hypothetical protein